MKRFSTDSTMKNPTPHQVMSSSKTTHRFQAAFTLVELLVVIAIVAILVALLFPLVGSMRIKSSSAISVSNLGKIGTAIMTYAADNNGTLPGPPHMGIQNKYYTTVGDNLPYFLRDYLPSVPQPQNPNANTRYSPTFDYPAAKSDGQNPRSAPMRTYVVVHQGTANPIYYPLGLRSPLSPPMTTAQFAANVVIRGRRWIQEDTSPVTNPPHGTYRNALMFDYSVQATTTN
jgi:prepilin-type N-terminal cleavage/methylation domain-containing protein